MKNLFLILVTFLVCADAHARTSAKQAIVVDSATNQVLFSKNADERMPTSSMSKVMTAYASFKAIEDGKLSLDEKLLVSEKAWRKGGSKMFVEVGKKVRVEDLLRGVIIQSGNDATIVLAEAISGTEEAFGEDITTLARDIGMMNTNFTNASGWPDPEHYSTARDLSILAKHVIEDFPQHYGYYSETEFTFSNIKQRNRNPLLYRNIGADGMKTGHTEDGGYGLIGSGVRDDRRVVIVLNGMESAKERASEAAKWLDWGLRRFENKTLFEAGESLKDINVIFGTSKTVAAVLEEDAFITIPVARQHTIKASVKVKEPLTAPISKGQEIGTLFIELPDIDDIALPLVSANDVKEKNAILKAFEKIQHILKGKVNAE